MINQDSISTPAHPPVVGNLAVFLMRTDQSCLSSLVKAFHAPTRGKALTISLRLRVCVCVCLCTHLPLQEHNRRPDSLVEALPHRPARHRPLSDGSSDGSHPHHRQRRVGCPCHRVLLLVVCLHCVVCYQACPVFQHCRGQRRSRQEAQRDNRHRLPGQPKAFKPLISFARCTIPTVPSRGQESETHESRADFSDLQTRNRVSGFACTGCEKACLAEIR